MEEREIRLAYFDISDEDTYRSILLSKEMRSEMVKRLIVCLKKEGHKDIKYDEDLSPLKNYLGVLHIINRMSPQIPARQEIRNALLSNKKAFQFMWSIA